MENEELLISRLDAATAGERLRALSALCAAAPAPASGGDVNNHIHTTYSFSPYSPAKAVWMARRAGLATAGIMDHDSIGGAREFIEAGRVAGLPVTVGVELRVSFAGTAFEGRRLNNPDQDGIAYVALHGIPHSRFGAVEEFLRPIRAAREIRSRAMCARLGALLAPAGLGLDFDTDVAPCSLRHEGGGLTERHILWTAAGKLLDAFGAGAALVDFVRGALGMDAPPEVEALLRAPGNPYVRYDLLGAMKSALAARFYIPASGECPGVRETAAFAAENGVIPAYAYLGDVAESPTGDKKPARYEDAFLDGLFAALPALGFKAVTFMPSRNTRAQLLRVMGLCEQIGLFQISGEDVNQPRQRFVCEAMRDPVFSHLRDAAWALVGHERLASANVSSGMFSAATAAAFPGLPSRIRRFSIAASA